MTLRQMSTSVSYWVLGQCDLSCDDAAWAAEAAAVGEGGRLLDLDADLQVHAATMAVLASYRFCWHDKTLQERRNGYCSTAFPNPTTVDSVVHPSCLALLAEHSAVLQYTKSMCCSSKDMGPHLHEHLSLLEDVECIHHAHQHGTIRHQQPSLETQASDLRMPLRRMHFDTELTTPQACGPTHSWVSLPQQCCGWATELHGIAPMRTHHAITEK